MNGTDAADDNATASASQGFTIVAPPPPGSGNAGAPGHTATTTLPPVKLVAKTVNSIPPNLTCIDRRKFTFPVAQTKAHNGNVISAVVYVNGKKTKSVKGKNIRSVSITKLPQKTFVVKVVTITTKHLEIT